MQLIDREIMEEQVVSERKKKTAAKKCYFCESKEGEPRILGKFIVELTEVELKNGLTVLACQSCSVHHRKDLKGNEPIKKGFLEKVKSYFT
jgi:Zn-finger protein